MFVFVDAVCGELFASTRYYIVIDGCWCRLWGAFCFDPLLYSNWWTRLRRFKILPL